MRIEPAISVIAANASGAMSNDSCELKRAARIMRSGSSPNETSGDVGVRRLRAAMSARPPYGSTKVRSGSRSAIALTVKSRRTRSSSSESPNSTTGLRVSRS